MSNSVRHMWPRSRGAWRPSFSIKSSLFETEGAGKTGCPPHPWSACNKKARGRTTGTSRTTGLPCAMVLRLIRALPGDQALLPPSPLGSSPEQLSASLGAPGPHDFAVRKSRVRLSQALASTASHRNVRDDRDPPLIRRETREVRPVICPTSQARFVRHVGTTGKLRMACMRELPAGHHGAWLHSPFADSRCWRSGRGAHVVRPPQPRPHARRHPPTRDRPAVRCYRHRLPRDRRHGLWS